MTQAAVQAIQGVRGGQVWTPQGFVAGHIVRFDGAHIAAVDAIGAADTAADLLDASDGYVVPGLVDVQVNGALGWSFQAHHRAHFDAIVAYHRQRGTTTLLPTLVTADVPTLLQSLKVLAEYLAHAHGAWLPGIHLEGPFLSPLKSGAHDAAALRNPDLALVQQFLAAARGRLAMVTLAPELMGSLPVIKHLAEHGIIVAAGHTAATYAQMKRAMAAGLSCVTHAGNASDWPHRAQGELGFMASEPGIVGTLLAEPDLACSVILDGYHFHPALLPPLVRVKNPGRVFLISDASTGAGCPPGEYESGGLHVTIHPEGFATSGRGGGWLAGSTITLLDAVQRAVRLAGMSLHEAVAMATHAPAKLLGINGRKGTLSPGSDADLLVLNRDLTLRAVIVGGYKLE
ncbi:MAG: N-acetylglucosamine-6-phosphate deacetylase [Caldilineaceae bacterium]|nr:N-acetylglucosamine-6-phosphate deacetylase [Caldilineaceae bacterium]